MVIILGLGKPCGQYKLCMALSLSYRMFIWLVLDLLTTESVLPGKPRAYYNKKKALTLQNAIQISDNPLSSPPFASFVLRLFLRFT